MTEFEYVVNTESFRRFLGRHVAELFGALGEDHNTQYVKVQGELNIFWQVGCNSYRLPEVPFFDGEEQHDCATLGDVTRVRVFPVAGKADTVVTIKNRN